MPLKKVAGVSKSWDCASDTNDSKAYDYEVGGHVG